MAGPMIYPLLSYLGGVISGRSPSSYIHLSLSLFILFVISLKIKNKFSGKLLSIYLLLFIFGFIAIRRGNSFKSDNHILNRLSDSNIALIGKVYRPVEQFDDRRRVYIHIEKLAEEIKPLKDSSEERTDDMAETSNLPASSNMPEDNRWEAVSGRVMINIYGEGREAIEAGDRLLIPSINIRKPRNFKNPGMFDYERYLADKEIYATGSTKDTHINIIEKGSMLNPLRSAGSLRREMLDFISRHALPVEGVILKGFALGELRGLDKEIRRAFDNTGTSHLLAISGMNIGFLAVTTYYAAKYILFLIFFYLCDKRHVMSGRHMQLAAIFTIAVILLYTLIAGAPVSAVRAALMTTVYLLSIILLREDSLINTVFAAAFFILLVSPEALFDIGFQLSFLAVLVIILTVNRFKERDEILTLKAGDSLWDRSRRLLSEYLSISIIAVFTTAPLTLFYFYRLPLYSVFANIAAVPLSYIITPSAIAAAFISLVNEYIASLILYIPVIATSMIYGIVKFFASLPHAVIYLQPPDLIAVLGYYLLLIYLFSKKNLRIKYINGILLILLIALSFYKIPLNIFKKAEDNLIEVTFLDVGHADSIFIKSTDGKTILIDGGSAHDDFDIGEYVIIPYLLNRGIRRLDYILATHPDNDHIGGLFSVIDTLSVDTLLYNKYTEDKVSLALQRKAKDIGINLKDGGDERDIAISPFVNFKIIHPSKSFLENKTEGIKSFDNNISAVASLRYKDISLLFTADIEKDAERFLVEHYRDDLKADILKIAHHGSRSSNTMIFLEAVSPHTAVISLKEKNRFRHPHKDVIKRLEGMGTEIYRTDRNGAVTIKSDGERYWVEGFR